MTNAGSAVAKAGRREPVTRVVPLDAPAGRAPRAGTRATARPTPTQRAWLERGRHQPGGKLPLFDEYGRRIDSRTIQSCVQQGWAEPWFANPLKPDWLVCKLTPAGRAVLERP